MLPWAVRRPSPMETSEWLRVWSRCLSGGLRQPHLGPPAAFDVVLLSASRGELTAASRLDGSSNPRGGERTKRKERGGR